MHCHAGCLCQFISTELRKESRRLETEIDLKLVSFSKLGSTYAHRDERFVESQSVSIQLP